ncbi:hypothetical protein K2173_000958 [Erythroxylum novogranatense]|uniref:DUF4283 domain-containing protein n=1 Tax=Erythroxylum novogranatense TaxID=1862640 RepID=A0AAV8TR56_9ROSI|nr:hypothetical protein K2173_000958 [Erythroxylum novogranatense]
MMLKCLLSSRDVEMGQRDEPKRKGTYRDYVVGFADGVPPSGEEFTEEVSEDDSDMDEPDDPECPTVHLTTTDKLRIRRAWSHTLIVKVLGHRIGYRFLVASLKRQWRLQCDVVLAEMGNDFYLVKLNCLEDYRVVLEGGPWMVADHILAVMKWCPNFNRFAVSIDRATVWIRIPHLPVEYYDSLILTRIGNKIGKTMRVDGSTEASSRAKYARISVEVDMRKPLLSKFRMMRKIWRVEYEGLHLVCFGSGTYGHHKEDCPDTPPVLVEQGPDAVPPIPPPVVPMTAPPPPVDLNSSPEVVESFGSWILVQKPKRGRHRSPATRGKPSPRGEQANDYTTVGETGDMIGASGKDKTPQGTRFRPLQVDEHAIDAHPSDAAILDIATPSHAPPARQTPRGGRSAVPRTDFNGKLPKPGPAGPRSKPNPRPVVKTPVVSPHTPLSPTAADPSLIGVGPPPTVPCMQAMQLDTHILEQVVSPHLSPQALPLSTGSQPMQLDERVLISDLPVRPTSSALPPPLTRILCPPTPCSATVGDLDLTLVPNMQLCLTVRTDAPTVDGAVTVLQSSRGFIHTTISRRDGSSWYCTFVYVHPTTGLKAELFTLLVDLAESISSPWLLVGDFNEMLGPEDKWGDAPFDYRRCLRFQQWVSCCQLVDLGFSGPTYT